MEDIDGVEVYQGDANVDASNEATHDAHLLRMFQGFYDKNAVGNQTGCESLGYFVDGIGFGPDP